MFVRSLENRLDVVTFDDLYGLLLSEEESLVVDTFKDIPPTIVPTAHIVMTTIFSRQHHSFSKGHFAETHKVKVDSIISFIILFLNTLVVLMAWVTLLILTTQFSVITVENLVILHGIALLLA